MTLVGPIPEVEPLTTEAAMTRMSLDLDDVVGAAGKTPTTVAMDFGRCAGPARPALSLRQLAKGFHGAASWRAVRDHLAERCGPPPNRLR